jgi:hypothetical protein
MKTYPSISVLSGLCLAAFFSTPVWGEDAASDLNGPGLISEESLGEPFASMSIPPEIDRAGAMNACVKAALGRKWDIVTKQDGVLKINLKQRGWDATVYFVVKDSVVELYSDSYVVNKKTGERKKKKDPEGWLRNLEKDVNVFMDREAYLE